MSWICFVFYNNMNKIGAELALFFVETRAHEKRNNTPSLAAVNGKFETVQDGETGVFLCETETLWADYLNEV